MRTCLGTPSRRRRALGRAEKTTARHQKLRSLTRRPPWRNASDSNGRKGLYARQGAHQVCTSGLHVCIAVAGVQGYNLGSSFAFGEAAMEIGKRLRELREAKRLSHGDVSERSGLARSYISHVECGHGTPTIEVLERWSAALRVPLPELFVADQPGVVAGGPQTGVHLNQEQRRCLVLLKRIDEPDRRLWFSLGLAIAKAQRAKS